MVNIQSVELSKILLFDSIQNPIFEVDKEGLFLFSNDAFQFVFNFEIDKTRQITIQSWLNNEKSSIFLHKIIHALRENNMTKLDLQVDTRWYRFCLYPIVKPDGHSYSVIVTTDDITDLMVMHDELNQLAEDLELSRDAVEENAGKLAKAYDELEYSRRELEKFSKQLEEQNKLLQESEEKQKKLNTQKDKFVSIISHDLRAPFTSILGYSEAMLSAWEAIPDEDKKEFIQIIYSGAQSQLELLDTLLQWSRLETGRVQLRPEVVNMYQLAKNCISNLSGIAQSKGITLINSITENINVLGDHLLLSQVVQNLISNSLKFTKETGTITISTDNNNGKDKINFSLSDTGIGMPESIRLKLFKTDSKVSRKGTKGEAGTGLGLIVCKEIIDLHHGSISVSSKENEGTTFYFSLIKAPSNILLIIANEEEKNNLIKLIKENHQTYEINAVNNLNEIENKLILENYSLVLYEKNSLSIEEDAFLELIKNNSKMKIVPKTILTSISDQEILESFLVNGIDYILPIPLILEKANNTLNRVLNALSHE